MKNISEMGNPKSWDDLTKTSSNTPMGRLLRRYWWPIGGLSDLIAKGVIPIRLLGEDLVLYRDFSGRIALLNRHCAHRGADLAHGLIEDDGIRCSYHGWTFNLEGRCIDAPFEEANTPGFCKRRNILITSYPVRELGGLLWAYLGPAPFPELPDWEFFHWENGFRQIVISYLPCNWLQCQENSVDPVHFEWQHSNYSLRSLGHRGPYYPTHTRLAFEEFEYGIIYRRLRTTTDETDPMWAIGRVCLWPNAVFPGNHIEYRVPIDDNNTLTIGWFFDRVPKEREPYVQDYIPTWYGPIKDSNGWITSHINNQDFMAYAGQGRLVDRSRERLGTSDAGIVMLRNRFEADLRLLETKGIDPKGVIRDSAKNSRIILPVADRNQLICGLPLREMLLDPNLAERLRGFIFQAGQPTEVREAFIDAMGIKGVDIPEYDKIDFLARKRSVSE